ncbi:MAG TPA: CAP domain-containing protein, partial [Kofleriaceae bacterium]
ASPVRVTDIPRAGDHFELAGTFADGVSSPRVTIDGKDKLPVALEDHAWKTELACPSPGEHSVAVEVTDPKRDFMPLVIFPVYCGDAPATIYGEPRTNLDVKPNAVAGRFVAILDRERAAAHLPALYWNSRLAVATATFVSDRSEHRNTAPQFHLRKAGIITPQTNLTVFHVDSLASAVSRILDDPDQRQKLLDPHFTDVAVSAKPDSDGYWMTVGYLAVAPVIDPIAVKAQLTQKILKLTEDHFKPGIVSEHGTTSNTNLSNTAGRMARDLAYGWRSETVSKELFLYPENQREGVSISIDAAVDVNALDVSKTLAKHADFLRFGVGVAQAGQDGPLAGMIYVVTTYSSSPY